MRLKSLEIAGFKSFADRVTIDFSGDVTCLVGPNGCGKSNVVDAIKWVLGEQRPSALRGDQMQDVIFKGNASGRRSPMNFAEVSLTIGNESGDLAVAFDEVVVTRRLFRSGESEYLLNRAPVRLKDIRKLFLNTGMGVGAYSIMEQGKIDGILEANPRDRRAVFEEAAGVSLLRVQRREAERKLERTAANLLRLGDIIEELEKRIRSLKNQAGRARSYVKLRDRLGELKRNYYGGLYRDLAARLEEFEEKTASAAAGEKEAGERLAAQRSRCESLAAELEVVKEGLHSRRSRLGELRTALSECDGKISLMEKRRGEIESERTESERRDEEIRRLLQGREEELKDARSELVRVAGREEELRREEEKVRSLAAAARERLAGCRSLIEDLENDIVDLSRKEVEVGNKMAEAGARLKGLHAARSRIVGKQHLVAVELFECRAKSAELSLDLEAGEKKFVALSRDLDLGRGSLAAAEAEAAAVEEQARKKEEKYVKDESRVELLESLLERREGVTAGARAVMEEAAGEQARLGFVVGMLGERLDVAVEDSRALEAVLGELAEAVVVGTGEERAEVLAFLKEKDLGGVVILTLSDFASRKEPDRGLPGESLARRIRCGAELRPLVNALAGEVLLVKDGVVPSSLSSPGGEGAPEGGDSPPRVNGSGDYFREGILKVGGGPGEPGVIARRSELAALRKETEAAAGEIADLRGSLARMRERIATLRAANDTLAGKVDEEEFRIVALNAEKQRMIDRMDRLFAEFSVLLEEGFDVEKGISSLAGEMGELEKERESIGAALRSRSKELDIANTRAEGFGLECSRYEATLKELEIALVEQRGKREGLEREKAHLEKDVAEFTSRLEELRLDGERLESFLGEVEAEVSRLKERTALMASEISDLAAETEMEDERARGIDAELERENTRAAAFEEEFESRRKESEELRIARKEVEVKQQGLRERALEEIETDPSALAAEEESSPGDSSLDLEALEEEIREVRTRIARIGNVNLEAVSELERVEERHALLTGQRDDLVKAERNLKEMIRDLKAESRKRFVETFEEVRSHFGGIFRKLFHGGRADIRLCGDEDVLDAGVEIIAGPPRKDVRSISLLSGGERSLTAVALLFALFKARPSPFCLLDEVDAALDETNIDRFCSLLGDFLGDSQFMIITHSKLTMSRADIIYGVTMEVGGVTKVVSLKLDDYREQVA